MLFPLLAIAAGILLLYGGAEGLVRGSCAIALRLGLTPLVIGLTVVAFGTSMPEMVVSIGASLGGNGAIAVGNVVGSNISNIALILGLSALIRPTSIHSQVIRIDLPVMLAVTLIMLLVLADGGVSRWEGGLLAAGLAAYLSFSLWLARREAAPVQQEYTAALPPALGAWWLDGLLVAGGLLLLVAGAHLLVDGAVTIAAGLGVSQTIIGLTIVAIGTSLPELATSIVAAFKGKGDIAVGNVVGSNIFNILGILGVASLVRPLGSSGISAVDLAVVTGLSLVLLPLMRTGWRLARWEGGLLLACYAGYMFWLIP